MLLFENFDFEKEKLNFKSYVINLHNNLTECCNNFNSNSEESKIKQSLNGIIIYFAIKRNNFFLFKLIRFNNKKNYFTMYIEF